MISPIYILGFLDESDQDDVNALPKVYFNIFDKEFRLIEQFKYDSNKAVIKLAGYKLASFIFLRYSALPWLTYCHLPFKVYSMPQKLKSPQLITLSDVYLKCPANWQSDPDEVYVVIDVETTGGSANSHRITEIGAVKVKGGVIIDEYQTLINPGRAIPSFISKLTGITDEMVSHAPSFSVVADDFRKFTEDAIFVAHNVRFDYGFIQKEFARLEIEFVRPFICTCAGMRKSFPGIKSYGLKNLTHYFQITLDQHHRALSDARAATDLLLLMTGHKAPNPRPPQEVSQTPGDNIFIESV